MQISSYTVHVDYTQSVEEMIAAGRYDWQEDGIGNFPFSKRQSGGVVIQLVHFDEDLVTGEVLAKLEVLGLRPAELPELLALARDYPDLQGEFLIAGLGSVGSKRIFNNRVPYLRGGKGHRALCERWFFGSWGCIWRFAAVSK